ncbi:MAG TPA: pentapeptide repeat-containing protein [Candidatus Saccharimonadales bacterium]
MAPQQKSLNPPLTPQRAAYEPYDESEQTEPIFEQLHLENVLDWPEFDAEPWRFDTCKLEQCAITSRTLPAVRIWDSVLVRCDLSANKFFDAGLLRDEFLGCRATGIQLAESTIKDVSFQNCKLNMANFRKCKLERVVFENCILDEADFGAVQLTDVAFVHCEMSKTDFSSSKSVRVDMTLSDIGGIYGVKSLKGVRISREQMLDIAPLLCAEVGLVVS